MAALKQTEINALIAKLKNYPYACSWGTDNLGPLSAAPTVAPKIETKEVVLYETGKDVQAEYLTKNDVKVTIKTRDVEKAMSLQAAFSKGDNIIQHCGKKPYLGADYGGNRRKNNNLCTCLFATGAELYSG